MFQEHLRDYKYENIKSKIVQHLIENRYNIGSMEDIMDILHVTKKDKMMNTLENFYTHTHTLYI